MTDIRAALADDIEALGRTLREIEAYSERTKNESKPGDDYTARSTLFELYGRVRDTFKHLRAYLNAENAAHTALRDQFAIAAFQGAVAGVGSALVARAISGAPLPDKVAHEALDRIVSASYAAADRMLAERDKGRT